MNRVVAILLASLVGALVLSVALGSVPLPLDRVLGALAFQSSQGDQASSIVDDRDCCADAFASTKLHSDSYDFLRLIECDTHDTPFATPVRHTSYQPHAFTRESSLTVTGANYTKEPAKYRRCGDAKPLRILL